MISGAGTQVSVFLKAPWVTLGGSQGQEPLGETLPLQRSLFKAWFMAVDSWASLTPDLTWGNLWHLLSSVALHKGHKFESYLVQGMSFVKNK